MDHVPANEQRYTEAAFLHSDALQLVDGINIDDVNHGPDPSGAQTLTQVLGGIAVTSLHLGHLTDLLGERHLREQGLCPLCRGLLRAGCYCFARAHA